VTCAIGDRTNLIVVAQIARCLHRPRSSATGWLWNCSSWSRPWSSRRERRPTAAGPIRDVTRRCRTVPNKDCPITTSRRRRIPSPMRSGVLPVSVEPTRPPGRRVAGCHP
jgi:hypothetical protein